MNKDENDGINQNYYNINKKLTDPKLSRADMEEYRNIYTNSQKQVS